MRAINLFLDLFDLFHAKLIGKNSYLKKKGVYIGEGVDILTNVRNFGSEPWLISVGTNTTIAAGVILITHDGSTRIYRKRDPNANTRYGNRFGRINIGSNVFVGVNAIIMPDVSIGNNCVVGAGSVVTRSIPDNYVAAGNPAKIICSTDEYIVRSQSRAIQVKATNREELRIELEAKLPRSSVS